MDKQFYSLQYFWGFLIPKAGAKVNNFIRKRLFGALLCLVFQHFGLFAQYALPQYPIWVESGVAYATVDNHAGCRVELSMDLYKPVNGDLARPLLVLLHGGIFSNGQKNDPTMRFTARDFASRGYVVACIDYREGWLLSNQSSGACPGSCWGAKHVPCHAFAADTAEVIRALYRAMQDAKTAIRLLKSRTVLDSTDCNRVFVGGHSFGGSAALMVGFLDKPSERPAETFALPPPPTPYNPPAACNRYNPCLSASLQRPDLGDINGNLYTDIGYDTQVAGVLSLSGGLPRLDLLQNTGTAPVLYVFHQLCDHVIPNTGGRVLASVDACLQSCCAQPACRPLTGMPFMYGGDALLNYIDAHPSTGVLHRDDVVVNGRSISPEFGCTGGMGGIPFCSNPNYRSCHDFLYNVGRMDYITFFLNKHMPPPTCHTTATTTLLLPLPKVFPNPSSDQIRVEARFLIEKMALYGTDGRLLNTLHTVGTTIDIAVEQLPSGIYWLRYWAQGKTGCVKFIKER